MKRVCIIGTGMAGYGAAHRVRELGAHPVLFDKRSFFGGHTASHHYDGKYTFDEGPHISFTKNERIAKLLADNVEDRFEVHAAKVNNYWRGHWIKHPAQINLHGLPTELVVEIIKDFVAAEKQEQPEIKNYEDWLRASFGNKFAETFPMEYAKKYHTTSAANLNTEWIGPRLYRAKLAEVLRGALDPSTSDVHYVTTFRYPSHGGFVSYLDRFMRSVEVRLSHAVTAVDPKQRTLRFGDGSQVTYDGLISSMPLPELIPLIEGAPREVHEAASRLSCSNVVIVNLVVDRPDIIDAHWTYFYDDDIVFTRISTPHMQSVNNVPQGCGALQVECYFSKKYRPLQHDPDACIEPVLRDLRRIGLLREEDRVLFQNTIHVEYANIIFDLEYRAALDIVHGYLRDVGIHYCGRYGDWAYIWTDESFLSGERAANELLGVQP